MTRYPLTLINISLVAKFALLLISFHGLTAQTIQPPFALVAAEYEALPVVALSIDKNDHVSNSKINNIYGRNIKVAFHPDNAGQWREYAAGYRSWVLKIKVEDASAISIVIKGLNLYQGENLYVYNRNEMKGTFNSNNIPHSGRLPIDYLSGNDIVIEFNSPADGDELGTFLIERVSIINGDNHFANRKREAESCYPCIAGSYWSQAKRSVVKIVTFRDSETIMCTGVLINNTELNAKPYILTGQHCIIDQADVDNAIFTFNDDDLNCGRPTDVTKGVMIGGKLRATSYAHDFSLVELNEHVPNGLHPYFSGWDVSNVQHTNVSCVHHAQGGVKKISIENDLLGVGTYEVPDAAPRSENSFWHVKGWDVGFTEGGSSGAPLFDRNLRVIGTLSGGASQCGSPYDDFFQRLTDAWNVQPGAESLQAWLDPKFTGKHTIDGFDPTHGLQYRCDTVTNVDLNELSGVVTSVDESGYLTGCNNMGVSTFAEEFFSADSSTLSGLHIQVGAIEPNVVGGVVISILSAEDGKPDEPVFQKYVPYSELNLFSNYVELYPAVEVKGKFFVSVTPDCSMSGQFAIEQANWRSSKHNTAWVDFQNEWVPISRFHDLQYGSSLTMDVVLCKFEDVQFPSNAKPLINVYPNPATSTLICSLSPDMGNNNKLIIYDLHGQVKQVDVSNYHNDFVVDTSALKAGVYILSVSTDVGIFNNMIVKQ